MSKYLVELANHVNIDGFSRVRCISIAYHIEYLMEDDLRDNVVVEVNLHSNWDVDELNVFTDKLRFEDEQEDVRYTFYGTMWYHDGTWSYYDLEYDSWKYMSCPVIPKDLR
jgi:hypothetical protein